jgi:alpha-glucosidase
VIFDEGWSQKLNIWKYNPEVDVEHLIKYAEKKGVGIILWMAWAQIVGEEERVAKHFAKLGAKGFKVDFMDRDDAKCVEFLWKFADVCAKEKMLVDYHGMFKPTGMERTYPNVLNFEGVHGLECAKWFYNDYDFPKNDIGVYFVRMSAGPMDYTPGAMDNYPIGKYRGTTENAGSVGTRCRQMAMMTMYFAPLQMLCDSPSKYEKNMECFSFMAKTPVVWDDTVGIAGDINNFGYAACARRKGDVWYAAGMTDSNEREVEVTTDYLGEGKWAAEIFRDHPEANTKPMRYIHETRIVKKGDKIALKMAKGGGYVIRFTPADGKR